MYQVYLADHFLRQLKFYLKKYKSLEKDLVETLQNFQIETASPLGRKLYKVRLKSSDLKRGKSKSFRMIIFLLAAKLVIVPITLYYKGDQTDIMEKEIEYHLAMVLADIRRKKYLSK